MPVKMGLAERLQQGNQSLVTSYDGMGNIVNQVERLYNGLGQLTAEYQSVSGAVDTDTTPEVKYAYTEMAGGVNNSRLTSITYPDGYVVNYLYGATNSLNDRISRLTSLSDSGGTLESYKYLGLDTVVERDHPQTHVNLTYISQTGGTGDAGDQYVGLDRFGRVVDQNWYDTTTSASVDEYQYGHDRDGDVTYQLNVGNPSLSALYAYNNLNELTSYGLGTLNSTKTGLTGSAAASQSWGLDALGNFTSVTTNSTTATQAANAENEYTSVAAGGTVSYDANGNMTADGADNTYVYDAWNRLVSVKNHLGTTVASYTYDGLGRQIRQTHSGTTTDLYYSSAGQVLEDSQGGSVQARYVWSPVYVNALILRDDQFSGGSPGRRLYALQDANWNVTALVNTSGSVVERYVYSPYGQVTILTPAWTSRGSSSYGWIYLFQGGRTDPATGLVRFGVRDWSPTLMRWMEQDPGGYATSGPNLYLGMGDNPATFVDPSGMDSLRDLVNDAKQLQQQNIKAQIQAADNAVASKIDAMNLTADEKDSVKKAIQQLLDASRFDWQEPTGFFGKCSDWVDAYNKRTKPLRAQLQKEMNQYFQVNDMFWGSRAPLWFAILGAAGGGHPYEFWADLDPGHAAIQIQFADGTTLYLDDGNLGFPSHIFGPNDIPSNYYPLPGFPRPFKK